MNEHEKSTYLCGKVLGATTKDYGGVQEDLILLYYLAYCDRYPKGEYFLAVDYI